MARTAGLEGLGLKEWSEFWPVRVVARLRQEGSAPAHHLADGIETDLKTLPRIVAAELETVTP